MPKRTDLDVPGEQLLVPRRQWAVTDPSGFFRLGHGSPPKATFDALSEEHRQRLASQIKVDERTLKELVNDAGVAVAMWSLAPTGRDVYSGQPHQALIAASIEFLDHVHCLSRRGVGRPDSEEAFAEAKRIDLDFMAIRQELTPLMKLINPAWQDSDSWDVRAALKMARALSDKNPQGEAAAGHDRDRHAAGYLTASWVRHTGRRPSKGKKRVNSPYRFYLALLGGKPHLVPSPSVEHPQRIDTQERTAFSREEVSDFREAVVEGGALGRAIQRWLGDPQNRKTAR
ncbi:hypothetical protein [Brevundimonas poindexterae]|uniref:hypothetical protein n=1 Tax=Brevundimonas poindexterae TaxID=74325 RepID=UPI001CFCFA73|nr:hypothetical protein [Brevundimonas poindexterae]